MDETAVRQLLEAAGEEIRDDQGNALGYIAQPARFKIDRPYLAMGGFLVVVRDEESGVYIGTEFDALPHPKTGQPYPAGHSEQAWRAGTLQEAQGLVMAYFQTDTRPLPDLTLDLRGDVCPLTFAKTKIALEEMEIGQVIAVLLDYEPATRNLPRSAEMYGDEVLHIGVIGSGEWQVLIRKRVQ